MRNATFKFQKKCVNRIEFRAKIKEIIKSKIKLFLEFIDFEILVKIPLILQIVYCMRSYFLYFFRIKTK